MGIEKTLARARSLYYWPGMNNHIKDMILNCKICEQFQRKNQKETIIQSEKPEYPFHRVGVDIFEYGGQSYLALLDSYSGLLCSERLTDKTAKSVISSLEVIFNRLGYPTEIRCDNVPFGSYCFKEYADEVNVVLVYSSPKYAQSNGLSEKGVSIAKNLLKRCYAQNKPQLFQNHILEYNTTTVASMKLSPSQIFFGRNVKTRLPIEKGLLCRGFIPEGLIQSSLQQKQEYQKKYYNRQAKDLPILNKGDSVMFRLNEKWKYGTIIKNHNPRSYIIQGSDNRTYRRNRKFLHKTGNYSDLEDILDDDYSQDQLDEPLEQVTIEADEAMTEEGCATQEEVVQAPRTSIEEPYKTRSGRQVNVPSRYKT